MVYRTLQGLYIKEGSKPPRQLTQHTEDINPRISDDGKKIVFERWVTPLTLYSINADGSEELALVTESKLTELNLGYDASGINDTAFVPGTHLLLFQTSDSQAINSDLLLVDTNTGEIKSLLPLGKAFDYYISPDGTKIALNGTGKLGHIDILSINGEMLQRNIVTYTRSEPIPILPDVHWAQDSKSLTIVLPYPIFYDTSGGAPNYTIWRYALDENKSVQVPLDPMPKDLVEVSPDGNWVTYHDDSGALYVGDLRDGSSQMYDPQPGLPLCAWSSDSVHFVYGGGRLYLGAVNVLSVFFGKGDCINWLDARRFLYYDYVDKTIVMGSIDGEKSVILTDAHQSFQDNKIFAFILLD
jgi:Tol biopolymer transport system component